MGWIKVTAKNAYQYLGSVYDSSSSAVAGIALYTGSGNAYLFDNTNSILNQESQGGTLANGEWHHVCGVFDGANGRRTLYVNGRRVANQTISNFADYQDVSSVAVGHYYNGSLSYPNLGSLTLVKFVRGAPTDEQIYKIWCDEKQMLKENAKCFMYFDGAGGSPAQCYGFDYDSSTDLIHVGNEDGRSDFRGLIRINNTTKGFPVKSGQYNSTHLAASGGLIVEDLA